MFRLLRYFSVTSLIAFVVVVGLLAFYYRTTSLNDVVRLREDSNITVAQLFRNKIWPEFGSWVLESSERPIEEVIDDPEVAALEVELREGVQGTNVVKVKLYNTAGYTVYSNEDVEMGEYAGDANTAFLQALAGDVFSELELEDTIVTFDGPQENRYVVESYVPAQDASGEIVGVFEIYADATPFVQEIGVTQRTVTATVVAVLTTLYIILFFIVRRADRILTRQSAEIQEQNQSLVRANHDLAVARRQAEEANQLKSQFLSTMSHELRTPLNAVIGYAQLQLAGMAGPLSSEQVGFQERILVNAKHLLGLINEVLDLSKIEAGRLDIESEPYDPRQLFEDVEMQNRVLAEDKQLHLEVRVDERLPDTLVGDAGRIKQVVINLLSNAIKFTDEGSVTVEADVHDADNWRVVVKDTGVGIAPHQQERIFEEFHQVDDSVKRGGTGLGLAIVRKLVIMMGGYVRLSSEVGVGSEFTVVLPIKTVDSPDEQDSQQQNDPLPSVK